MGGIGSGRKKTTTGITAAAGQIRLNDNDTTDWSTLISDYDKMRKGDPIIPATLQALKLPIRRSKLNITCEKTARSILAQEYIEYCFENLQKDSYRDGGEEYFRRHLLLMLDYGLSMFEPVWNAEIYNDHHTSRLLYMAPIQLETIYRFLFDDANVEFRGIEQYRRNKNGGIDPLIMPSEHLFMAVNQEEFGDVRGQSILRPARMVWNYKQQVMNSLARATSRGAGIPVFTIMPGDEGAKAKAEEMGRTVGNANQAYVIEVENQIKFRLEALKDIDKAQELLSYMDRQMFFMTLTQFMTSGLGENGSRAATSELKTPYELRIQDLTADIEQLYNRLIEIMIERSWLKGILGTMEYPKAKLSVPTSTDLSAVAGEIRNLAVSKAITLNNEDEKYLREMFGLPEAKLNEEIDRSPIPEKSMNLDMKRKALEIFEYKSAQNHYTQHQEKVDGEIDKLYRAIVKEVALMVSSGKSVKFSTIGDSISHMEKLYSKGFEAGQRDIRKEFAKIGVEKKLLANVYKTPPKKIGRLTKNLYFTTESYAENLLEGATKKAIAGSPEDFLLLKLIDALKTVRRSLSTAIMDGYTNGRADIMDEMAAIGIEYEYTSVLDESLCDKCGPLDGIRMTLQEILDAGLRIGNGRTNPDCDGGDYCRCQLVPVGVREVVNVS